MLETNTSDHKHLHSISPTQLPSLMPVPHADRMVAIDHGTSYTKVCIDRRIVHQFPSIVTIAEPSRLSPSDRRSVIWYNDIPYLCGTDALVHASPDELLALPRDTSILGLKMQEVLLAYIFAELQINGQIQTLCQTLPYSGFLSNFDVADVCSRKTISWTRNKQNCSVQIGERNVVPQGAGALVCNGYLNNPAFRNIIAVDCGSDTLDVLVLAWHPGRNGHVVTPRSCSTHRLSCRVLVSEIIADLKTLDGLRDRNLTYYDISEMHREKRYSIRAGNTVHQEDEILPIIQKRMKQFTRELNTVIIEELGNEILSRADIVVFGGGGVHWLDTGAWLGAWRTEIRDETANVRGQFAAYEIARAFSFDQERITPDLAVFSDGQ